MCKHKLVKLLQHVAATFMMYKGTSHYSQKTGIGFILVYFANKRDMRLDFAAHDYRLVVAIILKHIPY